MTPDSREAPQRLTDGSTFYWSRVFPTAWALGSLIFFRMFAGLKEVWLDGGDLLVDDPVRGTRISLRDVRAVEESRLRQVKSITLRLGRPTPLGSSVTFVPKGIKTFFLPYASSPVASRLQERLRRLLPPG